MEWKHDVNVMDALVDYVKETKDPLNKFLNALGEYNDGSPMFAFLQIYGVLVNRMDHYLTANTEVDALDLSLAEIANHPTVQSMVASMMQRKIDGGLNIDR